MVPKRKLFAVSVLALLFLGMFAGLGVWQIKPAQATTTSFGYAIVGGSDYETFGHNQKWACRFQANATGTLNTVTAYSWCDDATTDFIAFIYDDNNGSPNAVLGYMNISLTTSAGWRTSTTFSETIYVYDGSYYWLGEQDYGEINWHIKYDAGATNQTARDNSDVAPPDSTFGVVSVWNAYQLSIYATITVGNPAPSIDNIIIKGQKTATTTTIAVKATALGGATMSSATLYWNRTGSFANTTLLMSGTSAWANFTGALSSVGDNVECRVYINDSLNTWTTSNGFCFNIFSDSMALYVEGNKMLNGNGTCVVWKGYDYTYLMDTADGSWYDPDTGDRFYDFTKSMEDGMNYTLDFLVASGGNHIRVLGTVEYWVDDTDSYRTSIARFCELARDRGIYFMFTFWRVNSTGDYITVPWEDVGNGYIADAGDLADVWATVSDALKGYSNFVPEYWNEPPATEEWFNAIQPCLSYSRGVGIATVIDIACAPDGSPLTYDFAPGYTAGFQDIIPIALTYLNDTAFNLVFDCHAYWTNAYDSGNYGWYAYLYDDVVTWLNETGCYEYAEDYVLNVGEIGYNNFASNPTYQQAWLNNTMSVFDDLGIGYQEWAGPPWANSGLSNQWGFIVGGAVNFTLTTAGQIWLDHLGGTTYAQWLEGGPPPPPSVTLTVTSPTNTTYTSSSVSVSLSASGGTIDKIWWNCKNGSSWIYGSNQTYTTPTSMTSFVNGTSYVFYAWANNTDGEWDDETVMFTVAISASSVTIIITSPANMTYTSSSISISMSASGGTVDTIWWNIQFENASWLYAENQTYTIATSVTINENVTATFYGYANNTDGNSDEGSVVFTVYLLPNTLGYQLRQGVIAAAGFMGIVMLLGMIYVAIEGKDVKFAVMLAVGEVLLLVAMLILSQLAILG